MPGRIWSGKLASAAGSLPCYIWAAYARQSTRCGRLSWRKTRGGDKMRLGLFLTTLIGLAGASHISSAADATWAAVGALENGVSPLCGGGSIPLPEWANPADGQVDIKGNTLTYK